MATKVYMEALSPTMEEGRLISWLKNEGDEVAEGDVLAEVETDKATMELAARGAGVLRKRLIGDGDTANVGSVIAVIAGADEDISGEVGEDVEATQAATTAEAPEQPELAELDEADSEEEADVGAGAQAVAAAGQTEPGQAQRGARGSSPPGPTPTPGEETRAATTEGKPSIVQANGGPDAAGGDGRGADSGDGRVKASPLARRLAAENDLQIGDVQGSGPGGRIVKRDIESALAEGPPPAAPAAQEPAAAAAAATGSEGYRDIPLTQMRKTIAKRLAQSIGPIPTFYLTIEVDMGETMALRKRINERFADDEIKVSPNDLIIKAAAMALQRHPMVNASWTGDAIRQFGDVHIGVAVAVEEGLITPVIRNANKKGVTEIAQEVKELAGRAREKKLKPDEYTGATFSISNLGMFGIEEFTAVINPPEAAIIAVGQVAEKPVAENGELVVRQRMRITMSCDHRVIDGATGAQFLQTLSSYLEDPMMMIA